MGPKPLFSPNRLNGEVLGAAVARIKENQPGKGKRLAKKILPEPTGAKLALEKIKNNLHKIEEKKNAALRNMGLRQSGLDIGIGNKALGNSMKPISMPINVQPLSPTGIGNDSAFEDKYKAQYSHIKLKT